LPNTPLRYAAAGLLFTAGSGAPAILLQPPDARTDSSSFTAGTKHDTDHAAGLNASSVTADDTDSTQYAINFRTTDPEATADDTSHAIDHVAVENRNDSSCAWTSSGSGAGKPLQSAEMRIPFDVCHRHRRGRILPMAAKPLLATRNSLEPPGAVLCFK